jgi:hypothetical protein
MARKKRRRARHMNLGAVSKGDFVAIADILCQGGASSSLVHGFTSYFARQNPRFQSDRFERAATSCRR